MTQAARYASALAGVFLRDLNVLRTYRFRFVAILVGPIFSVTLFYYVSRLVTTRAFDSPDAYYAFVLVGILVLGILTATVGTPSVMVRQELVAGTFERMVLSPFGPVASTLGLVLFPLVAAIVVATSSLLFAVVAFGLHVEGDTAPLALPVAFLGGLAFASLGLVLVALSLVLKQAASGANIAVVGLSLVAGLYFPVELLPAWVRWVADVQPLTPVVDLLRHLITGFRLDEPVWTYTVKLFGFVALAVPAAAFVLSAAVRFTQRHGTIVEY